MLKFKELKKIIKHINDTNKCEVFDNQAYETILDKYSCHQKISELEYFDHGGCCICFHSDDNVYKLMKIKRTDQIKCFTDIEKRVEMCLKIGIPVLQTKEKVYEDDECSLFIQKFCEKITKENFTQTIFYEILKILRTMIINKFIMTDIRMGNFGIYKNHVYLYDYQQDTTNNLNQNNELLIKNLEEMENIKPVGINKFTDVLNNERESEEESLSILCELIFEIEQQLKKVYNNYQYVQINPSKEIILSKHTLHKYQIIENICLKNKLSNFSYLDAGCSIGGIGFKIAQNNPESCVTLNNITESELNIAKEIQKQIIVRNIKFSNFSFVNIPNTYNITSYFALWHHMLKAYEFKELMRIAISQTKANGFIVVEIPIEKDTLLEKVKQQTVKPNNINFECLDNFTKLYKEFDKFSAEIRIVDIQRIDYETNELNRYCYICEKK